MKLTERQLRRMIREEMEDFTREEESERWAEENFPPMYDAFNIFRSLMRHGVRGLGKIWSRGEPATYRQVQDAVQQIENKMDRVKTTEEVFALERLIDKLNETIEYYHP